MKKIIALVLIYIFCVVSIASAYKLYVVNNTKDTIYFQVFSVGDGLSEGVFLGRLKPYQMTNGFEYKETPVQLRVVAKREFYSGPPIWETKVEISEQNVKGVYITEKGFVKSYE